MCGPHVEAVVGNVFAKLLVAQFSFWFVLVEDDCGDGKEDAYLLLIQSWHCFFSSHTPIVFCQISSFCVCETWQRKVI